MTTGKNCKSVKMYHAFDCSSFHRGYRGKTLAFAVAQRKSFASLVLVLLFEEIIKLVIVLELNFGVFVFIVDLIFVSLFFLFILVRFRHLDFNFFVSPEE